MPIGGDSANGARVPPAAPYCVFRACINIVHLPANCSSLLMLARVRSDAKGGGSSRFFLLRSAIPFGTFGGVGIGEGSGWEIKGRGRVNCGSKRRGLGI